MFGWIRKKLGLEPKLGVRAHPVAFNPTPLEQSSRNVARMERLKYAIEHSTDAAEKKRLQAELTRRQEFGS